MYKYYMRAKEFQPLLEVNMSPTSLRAMAAQVQALAGMEFEVIVPGLADTSGDRDDIENDYSNDPIPRDIDEIVDFYSSGEFTMSAREISQARMRLNRDYSDWKEEKFDNDWSSDGADFFLKFMEEEEWNDDKKRNNRIAGVLFNDGKDDDEVEEITNDSESDAYLTAFNRAREDFENEVERSWRRQDSDYESAREEYLNSEWDEPTESDWIDDRSMADFEQDYGLTWPYLTTGNTVDSIDLINNIGTDFSKMIGRPVTTAAEYEGAQRLPGHYAIEPDSSIESGNKTDSGLEFISPPLPLVEMTSDLYKVIAWANQRGIYTNGTTGLHMNVSVPGYSFEKVDYVKLVLFLGDEYVLKQFGRLANTHCKSVLAILKSKAKHFPMNTDMLLTRMRQSLNVATSTLLHSYQTDKYVSIHTHEEYVEFRSPGGPWLDVDMGKLETTLYRFVVALDIACDPNKFKNEYGKKLYKLLAATLPEDRDIIAPFVNWSTGVISKDQLLADIKDAKQEAVWQAAQWDYARQQELKRMQAQQLIPPASTLGEPDDVELNRSVGNI